MKWADTFQPHHVQTLREHTGATKQPFHRHQCTEFFILRCTILSTNSFLSFPLVKSLFTDWQNDLWKHVSKLWIFILNYFRFELVSFHLFLLERHKWLFSNMLRHIGSLSSLAEEITVFFFLKTSFLLLIWAMHVDITHPLWSFHIWNHVQQKVCLLLVWEKCLKSCSYILWWQLVPYCLFFPYSQQYKF